MFYYNNSENKELEKRLRTIRSRSRKLDDLDDEAMLDENEDAELTFMTDVIKQIISNGTGNECTSEDEFMIFEEKLEDFVIMLYNISNLLHYVSIF
jgi:hypothetical protein